MKTEELISSFPKHLQQLLTDGIDKGFFELEGNSITYVKQGFTDDLSDPEEQIRAGLFYDLVEKFGYQNTKQIIDLEFKRTIGHPYKKNASRLDIILRRKDSTPFALFELKSESDYDIYFEDSIKTQLFERAANEDKGSGKVKYLIYYTRSYEEDELLEKIQAIDYSLYKNWDKWEADGRPNLRRIPENYGVIDKPPQFIKGSPNPENQLRENVRKEELSMITFIKNTRQLTKELAKLERRI